MRLGTLNTILNNAPLIIQGATKLIKLIRDRKSLDNNDDVPATLDGIKSEINSIHSRFDDNDNFNVEQIKLIEQLAKQNETLAESLRNTIKRQNLVVLISGLAFIFSIIAIVLVLNQ